jgi:hypothetical protein
VLHAASPQRLLPPIDDTEDLNSFMPPKRKSVDTAATMDHLEKKAKTTKKGKKVAPIAEEGKFDLSLLRCSCIHIARVLVVRVRGQDTD